MIVHQHCGQGPSCLVMPRSVWEHAVQRRVCPHEGRIMLSGDKRPRQVRQCLAADIGALTVLGFARPAAILGAATAAAAPTAATDAAGLCGCVDWCIGATGAGVAAGGTAVPPDRGRTALSATTPTAVLVQTSALVA